MSNAGSAELGANALDAWIWKLAARVLKNLLRVFRRKVTVSSSVLPHSVSPFLPVATVLK